MAPSLHLATLHIRDLGFSSTKDIKCARPQTDDVGEPLFGSVTLHHLMILISAPCLAITVISCIFLSWKHLHRYTAPQEQRQILRMVNLPVAYCLLNFLALCFYTDYMYIEPIAGIYEAFTIASLFFLVLEYVCPDGTDREKYFDQLPAQDKKGNIEPGGSLNWFQKTWSGVLQYPLTKLIFVVIQIITQYYGVYCENSMSPKYAHLWLFLADLLFIGGAFGATMAFYRRLAKEIGPTHKAKAKVISFVGIVAFQIIQGLVFHLMNGKLFSPSKKATYNDVNFGIPSFMTCMEAVIFSLIFHWSYSSKEYDEGNRMDRYGMGPARRTSTVRAIFNALNLSDIVIGTIVAIRLLFSRVQSRYGGGEVPQRQRMMENGIGMEPLSQNRRMRGYSASSDFNAEYSPPLEYDHGMHVPAMPGTVQDPLPSGRARTFRADGLRPHLARGEYEPLTKSREPSPSGAGPQYPRPMV